MTRKPSIPQKNIQPFDPQYIVARRDFARYCEDNGLRVDQKTLEQLHQDKWFVPALRIMRGVVEFKKIYAEHNGTIAWRYIYPKDIGEFKPIKIAEGKFHTCRI